MQLELQAELFRRYPTSFRRPGQRLVSRPSPLRCEWLAGETLHSFEFTAPPLPDFVEHLEDDRAPIDQWGIECGDGWFELIDQLAKACKNEIEQLILEDIPKERWPRIAQIKEKFGGLRFYVHGDLPEALRARIRHAEAEESFRICESCGRPGTLRPSGWVHTACDTCEAQYQVRKNLPPDFSMAEFDQRMAALQALLDGRSE